MAAQHNSRISQALQGYRELSEVLPHMTEQELREVLDIESASVRRPVMIERMVQRLVRLVEIRTRQELERRYAPWLVNSQ